MPNHKLVLGFAHWGSMRVPVLNMINTVKLAVENGIEEIDCAPHYGDGAQENILGVALLCLPEDLRNRVKISTKAGRVIDPNKNQTVAMALPTVVDFPNLLIIAKKVLKTHFSRAS